MHTVHCLRYILFASCFRRLFCSQQCFHFRISDNNSQN
jgi:hypothetical protein